MVDWELTTDYLRCNPNFHGHARYDCALIQYTPQLIAFVRLIFLFTCEILGNSFQFALVQPFTAGIGPSRWADRDLKLTRVKAVTRSSSIFIPIDSIIRGAVLFPDPKRRDEYHVVWHLDGDMFLRRKNY
jgi:hypothetical protein